MMHKNNRPILLLVFLAGLILSCQKELQPEPVPIVKLGSKWVYRYTTYYATGGVKESYLITYRITSEEQLGGESWLNVTDSADQTVYLFQVKPDGLYQYTNNNAYLFCKDPAVVGQTYNTYNNGGTEDFTVLKVSDTISYGGQNVAVNYYEGKKNGKVSDKIWYSKKEWIVRREYWAESGFSPYYRRYSLYLQDFVY